MSKYVSGFQKAIYEGLESMDTLSRTWAKVYISDEEMSLDPNYLADLFACIAVRADELDVPVTINTQWDWAPEDDTVLFSMKIPLGIRIHWSWGHYPVENDDAYSTVLIEELRKANCPRADVEN